MLILGWHGNPMMSEAEDADGYAYHDAAAVLLKDGDVIAGIEEERLNRIKHTSCFPAKAIQFCLDEANVSLIDLDAIVVDTAEEVADFAVTRHIYGDPRQPHQNGRDRIAIAFKKAFGADVASKLQFCRHHVAHLYSAWLPSGFHEALAICIDGDGDGASGLIAHCESDNYNILRFLAESNSLGNFYTSQLFFLGYQRFDEYKAMGLAPYGDPTVYKALFRRMYTLLPEGRYEIAPQTEILHLLRERGLVSKARRKGEPFLQCHCDYAAALQMSLEEMVEHMVRYFKTMTGSKRLCLAGGVGHNCTMNGRLVRSGLFDEVFIQPAAHDAGNALGAALSVAVASKPRAPYRRQKDMYFGRSIGGTDQVEAVLRRWHPLISFERVESPSATGAELLARGSIIGWMQGRSEFGPRALGNRSILGDPRPAENRAIVNNLIKKREEYRPFAPAVLEERLRDYFELPPTMQSVPFMVIVLPVRPAMRQLLGAVTHVDGTARVQSVSHDDNPLFYDLIAEFGKRTGTPVVLNTSFNNNAEPIVDSVEDGIVTFLTTGLHALVAGDFLIRSKPNLRLGEAITQCRASLPPGYSLVRRSGRSNESQFELFNSAGRYAGRVVKEVSTNVFRILSDERSLPIEELFEIQGMSGESRERVVGELLDLWSSRAISIRPT